MRILFLMVAVFPLLAFSNNNPASPPIGFSTQLEQVGEDWVRRHFKLKCDFVNGTTLKCGLTEYRIIKDTTGLCRMTEYRTFTKKESNLQTKQKMYRVQMDVPLSACWEQVQFFFNEKELIGRFIPLVNAKRECKKFKVDELLGDVNFLARRNNTLDFKKHCQGVKINPYEL